MAQIEMEWQTAENVLIAILDEQIKWYEGCIESDFQFNQDMDPKYAKRLLKRMQKLREELRPHVYIRN